MNIKSLLYPTKLKRKIIFILFDIISFSFALTFAALIHFDFNFILGYNFPSLLFLFIPFKLFVFNSFKLYDVSWRYISIQEISNIFKAAVISNVLLFFIVFTLKINPWESSLLSILLIDLILSFMFSSGFKVLKRLYLEVMRRNINKSVLKKTIIVGAGSSGEQLLRDINRSSERHFLPVGFVDDDPMKVDLWLQGVKVLGRIDDLYDIIKKYGIESILISVLTADRKFHRKILGIARKAGIKDVKVVATINDISNSLKVGISDIRDIDLSDLIGRQAVSINTKDITSYIKNKRVLITGAAGSIGSEISRQVTFYQPSEILILDINESDLANLELQLSRIENVQNVSMSLCDISNKDKVFKIFNDFRPDVVFHAAAYKHVPVMEKFPEEAVRVNIIGTYNLVAASDYFNVNNFILISTDKAVNPSSIMGVTKRIAENIVTGTAIESSTNFVAVRFGNVIGSRGSAIPIFLEQLKNGGPITITHPEMKRYFMSIPEAVALVLQAAATGNSGDVFVLDMGEPIKIVDIVRELIMLNNMIPDEDIKIKFTGIREGEKLFEEVLTAEEGVITTSHEKIYKARLHSLLDQKALQFMVNEFQSLNGHTSKDEWINIFKHYIPTFNPSVNGNYIYEEEEV